jgi:ketosteroid isomerase-like protein
MRFFHPEAVWDLSEAGIGTFQGAAAVRRFVEDWQGSYEEYEVEVEDVRDLGNGATLAISTQKGRPVGSSGDVSVHFAAAYTWADGLIVRIATYGDVAEALAAAERLAESRE